MSSQKLFLFGPPHLERDGISIEINRRKALALVIYLAVSRQSYTRDALATLFWPNAGSSQARGALRRVLSDINKRLGEAWLQIEGERVALRYGGDLWVDVEAFHTLWSASQTHPHPDGEVCADCLRRLTEATALYRDDFLAGFTLPDCPAFDEWQFFQTEGLRRELASALERLVGMHIAQEGFAAAIPHARRWLALDPLHEPAQRQLMQLYAWTGQQAAALRQYQQCVQFLDAELGISPAEETTTLYERIRSGQLKQAGHHLPAPALPALTRPLVRQHNLPPQTTPFVGRENELTKMAFLLDNPEVRLVTILGPGGIGKTRLAVEAAKVHLDVFTHGAWFVPLTSLDPTSFTGATSPLVTALADALDITLGGGDSPRHHLLAYLQEKEMLIIFDNFEHLLETAGFISDLFNQAPRIKVLVTSHERLNLQEEWLLPLQGMDVPAEAVSAPEVENYGAVQLFWQHARRVQPNFDLPVEQAWIVRICQLLEGMPLGIELAAAWVRLMPCQAIVREIEQNIDFLTTQLHNVPERHRSLRAVFDHSWRLLSAAEQVVLKKLSVFRGGFQREAAEAVAEASLLMLSTLVDKSLLYVTPAGRYELHEHLRQYAAEKLQQNLADYEQTRNLHCLIYLDFLRQQGTSLKEAGLKVAQETITADIDNVRAAWSWAIEQDRLLEIKQVMAGLLLFYEAKGWYLEADEAFGRAVTRLRQLCDMLAVAGRPEYAEEIYIMLGLALVYQGWFQCRLGYFEQSKTLFEESLGILRQPGESAQREMAHCLLFFGTAMYIMGEPAVSISLLQGSLPIFEQVGDRWGSGTALSFLGQATLALGQLVEAERFLQKSLSILNGIVNQLNVAYTISALGYVAQARGQIDQAERFHLAAFKIRTEIGEQTGLAFTLCDLGEVARLKGAHHQARQYYEQSLALAKEIGLHPTSAEALRGLGNLAERAGEYTSARQFFQESLDISAGTGMYTHSPSAMTGLGWVAFGLGEYQSAKQHFYEALKLETYTQRLSITLDALAGLAHYLAKIGQPEPALELLALALRHPAATQETKERSTCLQAELEAELPPETIAAAQGRGKERTLEEMVAEILDTSP